MFNKDLLKTVKNSDGKIIKKPMLLANSSYGITEYEYDTNGNMICEKNTYFGQEGNFIIKSDFDKNNLLLSKTTFVNDKKDEETVYEYNENNLLCSEITFFDGQKTSQIKYEYDEKNRKVKETNINCQKSDSQDDYANPADLNDWDNSAGVLETLYEYITDNHYKETTKYPDGSVQTEEYEIISPECKVIRFQGDIYSYESTQKTDGNLVTEVSKYSDGSVSETVYFKEHDGDINLIFEEKKDKDNNITKHEKYLYDSEGVLEGLNIKGSFSHPVNVNDLSVSKKPVIEYQHYKSMTAVSKRGFWCSLLFLLPLALLSLALGLVNSIGIMIAASAVLVLLAILLIASAPSNIKLIKEHKDKLISYTVDTIDMSITFNNVCLVPGAFEIRNFYHKDDIIFPIHVYFNAIKSAEYVKSSNNFATDKLVLTINDYEPLEIPASKEVLNTLSKFIPVKNYGFVEKHSFIKMANMDDIKELRKICKE